MTFDGEYYRTRNATIYDRPAVSGADPMLPPPARSSLNSAGRSADGFICSRVKPMVLS